MKALSNITEYKSSLLLILLIVLIQKGLAQIGTCSSATCLNGRCASNGNTVFCLCNNGFTGAKCDSQLVQCSINQCLNAGSCFVLNGRNVCNCQPNFTGTRCEFALNVNLNPCQSQPCLSGGTCINIPEANIIPPYACVCPTNYTGIRCETFNLGQNPCLPNPCVSGGVCTANYQNSNPTFTCSCPPNLTGLTCNTAVVPNLCLPNPCFNGVCIQSPGLNPFLNCLCNAGYTGVRCDIFLPNSTTTTPPSVLSNTCVFRPCQNSGTCVSFQNTFICSCPPNFFGTFCEQRNQINSCSPNPCQNGGTCLGITQPGVVPPYACICQPNFNGINCQTFQPITTTITTTISTLTFQNPCFSNPCRSGGTCLISQQTFLCQCIPSYSGRFCEQFIGVNLCSSNTCYNGGTCQTQASDQSTFKVVCFCPVNFTGSRCQTTVQSTKYCECFNNGICLIDGTCQCLANYYGRRCEFYLNPTPVATTTRLSCPTGICNQGTCVSLPQSGSFNCQCFVGWTGPRCNVRNFCDSQCKNGAACFTTPNGYICSCLAGFTGINCEISTINSISNNSLTCANFLCLNGGTCQINILINNPECNCQRGYLGLNCEQDICRLPLVYGSCLQSITRYYYNSQLKICQPFQYTGCRANQNNFESLDACNLNCSGH